MITQKFKGDDLELQMEAVAKPALDTCGLALDEFYEKGYDANPFLLMLYDEGRMPFSDRVPRDSFVDFFREALGQFPFTGTFESYIFIIQKIFGEGSSVLFDVPAAGKLEMLINAASNVDYDFIAREFTEGSYELYEVIDQDGNVLSLNGISGIDSEYELTQLLAELIPAGIYPDIALSFFALYDFISSDGSLITDHLHNQIVFFELGA